MPCWPDDGEPPEAPPCEALLWDEPEREDEEGDEDEEGEEDEAVEEELLLEELLELDELLELEELLELLELELEEDDAVELCVERELGELLLCDGDEGELGELGEDEALGMDGEELLLELLCCCSRQPPSNNPVLMASAKAVRDRIDGCTDHTGLAAAVALALRWAGLLLTWLRSLITLPHWGARLRTCRKEYGCV